MNKPSAPAAAVLTSSTLLGGLLLLSPWWLGTSATAAEPIQNRPSAEPEPLEAPPLPASPAPVEDGVGDACRFTGRVVTLDGQPADGALVVHLPDARTLEAMGLGFGLNEVMRFRPEQQARFARATCDAEGRFELEARFVAASDPNRDEWEWTQDPSLVVFQPGYATRAHLCAGFSGGDYDAGDVRIETEARLAGRVVDEGGEPIAGAVIMPDQDGRIVPLGATTAGDRGSGRTSLMLGGTTTGADGSFMLGGLWNGKVQFWVTAPGYVWRSLEQPVSAARTLECGDLTLSSGGRIEGVVLDARSAPVAGARVFTHWLSPEEKMRGIGGDATALASLGCASRRGTPALTDADGRFELRGLSDEPVEVVVDAAGFEAAAISQVWPGGEPVVFDLQRDSRLVVDVVDSQGHPIEDAVVTASRSVTAFDGALLPIAPSDEAPGRFEVARFGPGTYVEASAPGFAPASRTLEAAKPGAITTWRVELARESRVVGHVQDAAGTPLRGVLVLLIADREDGKGPPRQVRAVTDADGDYLMRGLPPRTWEIRVQSREYPDHWRWACETRTGETVAAPDLILRRQCVLRGRLVDGAGRPKAGLELFTVDAGDADSNHTWNSKARTDVEGRFVFGALSPGRWSIHHENKLLGEFEVGAGEELEVELVQPTRAVVTGVLSVDGEGVGRGMVVALHDEVDATPEDVRRRLEDLGLGRQPGQLTQSAGVATDADGRYELALEPGDYLLVGFGAKPPLGRSLSIPVHLEWGDVAAVDLTFGGSDVAAFVSDTVSGRPVEGALLRPRFPDRFDGPWPNTSDYWPATDAAGQLLLRNVPAGLQTLECEAPGYVARTVECLVPANGPLHVELEPCGIIRGVVAIGPSGVRPSYLTVEARRKGQRAVGTNVGPGGKFTLEGVPPGTCRLFVRLNGWDYGDDGLATPLDVVVKPGEAQSVELTLRE